MRLSRILFATVLLFSFAATGLKAQQFDYQKYPRLNFAVNHLDLDVSVRPEEGSLKGTATYRMTANIDGAISLAFQAAHMEIEGVSLDGKKADFRLENDSLLIELTDSSAAGKQYTLSVDYSGTPRFGLLKDEQGTLWTSQLPKSNRHWLPVIDNPRVAFTTSMTFTVPSGYSLVATGTKTADEIVNIDTKKYTYTSSSPVPASALSFAAGAFTTDKLLCGNHEIRLASEKGINTSGGGALLQQACTIIKDIEGQMNVSYPYKQLQLIELKDHHWETKSWGAGVVFLYENSGNLEAQLRRALYGQWFGVRQRIAQWSDAGAENLLQAALSRYLNQPVELIKSTDVPDSADNSLYAGFSTHRWNRWQNAFDTTLNEGWRNAISQSLQKIMEWEPGVYTFKDYAGYWYKQTGQPRFSLPPLTQQKNSPENPDTVKYRVDYRLNEQNGQLKLVFNAEQGAYSELVTLPVHVVTSGGVQNSEVTFTGRRDSVVIKVPVLVKSVDVDVSSRPKLVLDQYKPVPFLIYDLRNASTEAERVQAARKLAFYKDNPDLQLAIKDFMNPKTAPKVRAALLRSLGAITGGASGTEKVFLDALKSPLPDVQEAGLSELQNYKGNAAITEAVQKFAARADRLPLFKNATRVLSTLTDTAAFYKFTSNVVETDTAGHKAIFAVQQLANLGDVDHAVKFARYYISDVYDYGVRVSALAILFQHDHIPEEWKSRFSELLKDSDPRIRFIAVQRMPSITGLDYKKLLGSYVQDEYDQRVYMAMQKVLGEE